MQIAPLSSITTLQTHLSTQAKANEMIFNALKDYRQYFIHTQEQTKSIITSVGDMSNKFDQLIQAQFDRIKRLPSKLDSNKISRIPHHIVKPINENKFKIEKMQKQQQIQYIKQMKFERKSYKDSLTIYKLYENEQKFNFRQQNQIVQIYVCYMCFSSCQQQRTSCMWLSQTQYETHLLKIHQIDPQFQVVLRSNLLKIPFSHAYFQKKLVNLFKNTEEAFYEQIYYNYKEGEYEKLYVCQCIYNEKGDRDFSSFPVFVEKIRYILHCKSCQSFIINKGRQSSHQLAKFPGKELIIVRPFSDAKTKTKAKEIKLAKCKNMIEFIDHIEKTIERRSKMLIKNFLKEQPLNTLEFITKNPSVEEKSSFYLLLPYCKICEESFSCQESFKAHIQDYHSSKDNRSVVQSLSVDSMKKYLSKRKQSNVPQIVRVQGSDQEQNLLLNLQLSLINPKIYICGECDKVFKEKEIEYMTHIYCDHTEINRSSSHIFSFLMKDFQAVSLLAQ